MKLAIHYSFHFIIPLLISKIFFKDKWLEAFVIMIATMLIDLDHLFASPVFDSNRCSIGFHPLHSIYALFIYMIIFFGPSWKYKAVSIGCLWHLSTDYIDCLL